MASINDCHTLARGCTTTLYDFTKDTFNVISKTYSILTPELWKDMCSPSLPIKNPPTISMDPHQSLWREPIFPDFKLHYKTIRIKTVW